MRIEIKPRRQFRSYLESDHKRGVLVVHRRGGKTFSTGQKLIKCALTHKRPNMDAAPLRYGYFAPTLTQAKDVAWGYIKNFGANVATFNESELHATFPSNKNARIRLYSGENFERARGLYFDGVVMDESGDMPPEAWESVIEPALLDYDGWADWIGTPKGKNDFWRKHQRARSDPDWFSMVLRASESGIIPADKLAAMRIGKDPKVWAREMECDFSSDIPGAVYAALMEDAIKDGRVTEFNPTGRGVYTLWDIGSPANTAVIYFEVDGPTRRVIDADIGLNLHTHERASHMAQKGYNYLAHFTPHDAENKMATGLSFNDELRKAGLQNVKSIPRTRNTEIRISATKKDFPNFHFRKSTTEKLRDALSMFHYEEANDGSGWITNRLAKGWFAHPCDAFGMLAEAELNGMLSPEQGSSFTMRPPRVIAGAGY